MFIIKRGIFLYYLARPHRIVGRFPFTRINLMLTHTDVSVYTVGWVSNKTFPSLFSYLHRCSRSIVSFFSIPTCLVVVPNPIRYSIVHFPIKCSFNYWRKRRANRSIDYLFSTAYRDAARETFYYAWKTVDRFVIGKKEKGRRNEGNKMFRNNITAAFFVLY